MFKSKVRRRVVPVCADWVIWNKDSSDLPRSFAGFDQTFPGSTVTSLKSYEMVE